MPTTNDKRDDLVSPLLYGGISKQPAHARFGHQVADAANASFSVTDGASKRPGTVFVRDITSFADGSKYRMYGIDRDPTERYLVVYGLNTLASMEFSIYEMGENNQTATVTISSAAQNYLDYTGPGGADDLRLKTIADYTLIANIQVPTALTTTPLYDVERAWRDYDVMISFTSTDGYYFNTENASGTQEAGYWQYDVDGITFAHINLATFKDTSGPGALMDVGPDGHWRYDTGANPKGFRIAFGRFGPFTITSGATWKSSTKTITKASAFTNYFRKTNDHVFIGTAIVDIDTTTNLAIGWYKITSSTSGTLVLSTTTPISTRTYKDSTGSTVAEAFIGNHYEVIADFTTIELSDMQDVAAEWQKKLRAAGASEACVAWYGRGEYGAFQITGPYRGSNATCYSCVPPNDAGTPPGNVLDETQSGWPFDGSGYQIFNGTGTVSNQNDTLPPESRWKRVPAPGQDGGSLFTATSAIGTAYGMPVQLVRQSPSSTGNFTVATGNPAPLTITGHGLVTGQTITTTGTNTTATTVGTFVVTVVDANTVTIPVNVTVVTDGTGSFVAKPYFTIDVVDWTDRTSGDSITNPAPKPIVNGGKVRDIGFHRNRLVLAIGESLVFSAANDLFRFYNETATNIVDSDPITAPLSGTGITTISRIADYRNTLAVFTIAGQQFDFGTPDALTPSTASATPTTKYQTKDIAPVTLGNRLYFVGTKGCESHVLEYFYDDLSLSSEGNDITQHVPDFIPDDLVSIVGSENTSTLYILPESGDKLYVHQSYWSGPRQRQQSAWTVYDFDDSYVIYSTVMLADRLYMLTKTANLWFIERLPLVDEDMDCHYDDVENPPSVIDEPYRVKLDRRFFKGSGSGTFNATDQRTAYNLGVQTPGSTINRAVVLGTGEERNVVAWSGTTVYVSGDTSGEDVILGNAYTMSIELNRQYAKNHRNDTVFTPTIVVDKIVVTHSNTGEYYMVASRTGNSTGQVTFSVSGYGIEESGIKVFAEARGDADIVRTLGSSTARPVTINGVQFVVSAKDGLN